MPVSSALDSLVKAAGKAEGRRQSGVNNIKTVDMLNKGDIYIADGYLKVRLRITNYEY